MGWVKASKGARDSSNSLSAEMRAWSVGSKRCQGLQQLTVCRAKDALSQYAQKDAQHQLTNCRDGGFNRGIERVPETGITYILQMRVSLVSGVEMEPETITTHLLQSQEQACSAGLKGCQKQHQLTSCGAKSGFDQSWQGCQRRQQLTDCRAKSRLVSCLEVVLETATTYILQDQGELGQDFKGC